MTVNYEWVGLSNYKELMLDGLYWNAFVNSFKYSIMVVPVEMVFSLIVAYVLNDFRFKGRSMYRTLFFLPVITTASIVGIIMIFIWSVQGPVNGMITNISGARAINFLGNQKTAMITVVLISVWKDCGTYMIYWLAGLQSISRDIYEAAEIDGAGKPRIFISIVLPLLMPIGGVIALLCAVNSLKVFDIIKTLTDGGPYYATDVVATYVYRTAFSSELGMPRLGYASSAAVLFGIIVITIGIVMNTAKSGIQRKTD
jgi:multiple sugar transport system permease protein